MFNTVFIVWSQDNDSLYTFLSAIFEYGLQIFRISCHHSKIDWMWNITNCFVCFDTLNTTHAGGNRMHNSLESFTDQIPEYMISYGFFILTRTNNGYPLRIEESI